MTIQCLVEKNGVDSNLAKFMVPIGAVINMDGTALYEGFSFVYSHVIRDAHLIIFLFRFLF